jgi:hypothetical protein
MAEPSEMRGRLARLGSELAADQAMIATLGAEISAKLGSLTADGGDGRALAYLAVQLHRYYTALVSAVERIERVFGSGPSGGDWHVELLQAALIAPLREVLRFRHFFRHAYAVDLDAAKLARVGEIVSTTHPDVVTSLGAFAAFMAGARDSLA